MFRFVSKMKNKKGFTLMELIIVLAILGIIAAIAVPRYKELQQKTKDEADAASIALIENAAEIAFVNGDIIDGTSDEGIITTDSALVEKGYLDEVPKSQDNSSFSIDITTTGSVTVKIE